LKLLYFFDPHCGWCYALHPVLQALSAETPDLEIQVICGGMILGDRVGPIGPVGAKIAQSFPRLESMTGAQFGDEYKRLMASGELYCSSMLCSKAVKTIQELYPALTLDFISAMQKKNFVEAQSFEDLSMYSTLCDEFNIPAAPLMELLQSEKSETKANEDFAYTQSLGISGFPALVAEQNGKLYLIAEGYTPLDTIKSTLDSLKKEAMA
jgi:putative protein-disulfide isomerase